MTSNPVIVEETLQAPIGKVWNAISDNRGMKEWYFDIHEFVPEIGCQFQFVGGTDEQKYLHICQILDIIELHKLVYSWRYEGYEGESVVTFELFAEGDATKLVLIHEGLDSFPRSNPDFARENFEMGWQELIGNSLKQYVEQQG